MHSSALPSHSLGETHADPPAGWLATAVALALVFLATEHSLDASLSVDLAGDEQKVLEAIDGGSPLRKLAFLSLAALGGWRLLRTRTWRRRMSGWLGWLLLAYVGWCVLSISWSVDAAMSLRRVAVLLCFTAGALGVASRFSTRQLCSMVLLICLFYVLCGVLAEIRLGTFRPWSGSYRFAGTVGPNAVGAYLALICFAAWALRQAGSPHRTALLTVFVVALVLLALTRSRSSLGSLLLGLSGLWVLQARAFSLATAAVMGVWLMCGLATGLSFLGYDVEERVLSVLLMGREEQATSLTGRLPLWIELLDSAAERPLLGYGYDSFWDGERVLALSESQHWYLSSAHSAVLESVLSVGIVGASLLGLVVVVGLRSSIRRYTATGDPCDGFVVALLLAGLVNAAVESEMVLPFFVTFVTLCGLVHAALSPVPLPESSCSPETPLELPSLLSPIEPVR